MRRGIEPPGVRPRFRYERSDIISQLWQNFREEGLRLGKHWDGCHNCKPEDRDPNAKLDVHHVVDQQRLKEIARREKWPKVRLLRVLTDPRNSMLVCDLCHHGHTSKNRRLWRESIRPYVWAFTTELGLTDEVRRNYPTRPASTGREEMSIKIMALAWEAEGLKPAEKLTLLAIADRADDDGRCWPGQVTLAEKCETTDRTIRNHMKTLQEAGLLRREGRTRENGSRTSDYLILTLDPPENSSGPNRKHASGPDTSGSGVFTEGDQLSKPSGTNKKVKKVGGKVLTEKESGDATAILDRFNERNDSKLGAWTSSGAPSPNLKPIVERLREHPNLTRDEVLEAIDKNFANPWWEGERCGVYAIFSPNTFPRALTNTGRPTDGRTFDDERRVQPGEEVPW